MKVIDLLNKIANGEELHFYVINNGFKTEYFYEKGKPLRYDDDEDVEWRISEDWLNCEVEIIEEDKPALAREELENRIENALEFLETQYNTYPSGQMWREALKNTLLGKEADNVYEPFEEDKKIEKLEHWVDVKSWVEGNDLEKGLEEQSEFNKNIYYKINEIIDKLNEMEKE